MGQALRIVHVSEGAGSAISAVEAPPWARVPRRPRLRSLLQRAYSSLHALRERCPPRDSQACALLAVEPFDEDHVRLPAHVAMAGSPGIDLDHTFVPSLSPRSPLG